MAPYDTYCQAEHPDYGLCTLSAMPPHADHVTADGEHFIRTPDQVARDLMENRLTEMANSGATTIEIERERVMSEAKMSKPATDWVDDLMANVPPVPANPHYACDTIDAPPCPTGEHKSKPACTRTLAASLHSHGAALRNVSHPLVKTSQLVTAGSPADVRSTLIARGLMPANPVTALNDWSAPTGRASVDNCEAGIFPLNCQMEGVTRPACCGTLLCSSHARQAAESRCPVCDSVMSGPLAAFDEANAARMSQPAEPIPTVQSTPDWGSDAWISDGYALSVERVGSRDVSRFGPRFGVSVEWWDDNDGTARRAVIGSYDTSDVALAEMARIKRLDRFDRVTGVVALYASESDL
jgi:hypothetical protein